MLQVYQRSNMTDVQLEWSKLKRHKPWHKVYDTARCNNVRTLLTGGGSSYFVQIKRNNASAYTYNYPPSLMKQPLTLLECSFIFWLLCAKYGIKINLKFPDHWCVKCIPYFVHGSDWLRLNVWGDTAKWLLGQKNTQTFLLNITHV